MRWFALEPLAATRQLGLKLVFFVAPPAGEYDVPAVQPLLRRALGLPLRWLTLLAVGCLAVLVARRTRPALPWALHWASAAAVALLFYCNGRYAVGLVPSVAALCGLGLGALNEKGRRRWVLVLAVPFLVLALPVVAWSDRLVERLGVIDSGAPGATFEAARARYLEEQAAMPDVFWPTSPPRARGRCRRRRVRAAGRESRARQVRLGLGARRHAGRRAPSSGRALRRGAAAGRPRGRGGLRVGIGRSLRRSGAGGQRLPPEPGPAG